RRFARSAALPLGEFRGLLVALRDVSRQGARKALGSTQEDQALQVLRAGRVHPWPCVLLRPRHGPAPEPAGLLEDTALCRDFTELGSCADGRDCKFAHGRHELRPGSAAKLGRKGERKAELEVSAAKPSPLKLQRLLEVKAAADDFDVSFWSRQTTLEDGRPIAEAEHSDEDAASVASDAASLGDPEVRLWEVEVPRLFDAEIQVKNTFVEMKGEQRSLRRILSEPSFMSSIS
ncbi:unnamed protein product, partial [Effrenium voratum]